VLFEGPAGLEPPPELAAPSVLRPELPGPPAMPSRAQPMAGVDDFRLHIVVGALLAFVSTLVLPILFGPIAMALGWLAYARGRGAQRRQGLLVVVFAAAATVLGTYLGLWASQNLLP
jgi:hypothetical protein